MITAPQLAASPLSNRQARYVLVVVVGLLAAPLLGLAAGALTVAGHLTVLVLAVVPVLLAIVWRRPAIGIVGIGFAGIVIEQYRIGAPMGDVTDRVPFFTSLSDGFGLAGVYVNPLELCLAVLVLVMLLRASARRRAEPLTTYVGVGIGLVLLAASVAAVHGLGRGGDFKMTMWEIRPYVYMATLFFLGSQLPSDRRVIDGALWAFVAAVAVKSLQGLVLVALVRGLPVRPDYLLSHDDAFFFGVFLLFVAALWIFDSRSRLRTVATALLPIVVVVDLANSRRTAWLIIGASFIAVMVLAWVRLPKRRWHLVVALGVVLVALSIYLPLYWDSTGTIGQPARAIRSAVAPSDRDQASDLYRLIENADLSTAIRQAPLTGVGFGIPIDYSAGLVDLSRTDPFIKFIPHDGLLYVWMRMGFFGALAFWAVVGAAVIAGCRLARLGTGRLAVFGVLVVVAVVSYVIEGYYDMGLYWFRIATFMGTLLGLGEVALRITRAEAHDLVATGRGG